MLRPYAATSEPRQGFDPNGGLTANVAAGYDLDSTRPAHQPPSVNRIDLTGDAVVTLAADYSFAHPKPESFKPAGYDVVLRYVSHTTEKNITHAEAKELRQAGLSIGLVWETTADRATGGEAAAEQDRVSAEDMAADIGYPKTCVIFYAVDEDVSPDVVNDYFAGLAKGATHPVGVYGSLRVCEGMRSEGHVTYLWQTEAWSGTDVSKHAHIYQRVRATKNIPDGCDEDVLLKPLPLWAPHSHDQVDPTPDPAAVGTATGIGPMPRIAARVVLKALNGRKNAVGKPDRSLLAQLSNATGEALKIGLPGGHGGDSTMVR
jgi:hypothetical protein